MTHVVSKAALSALDLLKNGLRRAWPHLRRFAWGRALGLLFSLLFCLVLLMAATRASDKHYERNLVAADTSYNLMNPAIIMSGWQDLTLKQLARNPSLQRSSDRGTEIYVLHNFTTWFLHRLLPLRPAMAVMLNGVWLVAMAVSLYTLFWSRIGRWPIAMLLTITYIITSPFVTTVTYGITSADPNIVAFMLGTSALCCVVLSDRFQRGLPCLFAGLFLGLLVLARAYTLGVVLPAMLPFVLSCFFRRTRDQILHSLGGGLVTVSVMILVCGGWLKAHWPALLAYPTQFGSQGVLSKLELKDALFEWARFPKATFTTNLLAICVLTWPFGVALLGQKRSLRSFNWAALWAAFVPLLVLAKLGATFQPYAAVALFGAFLLLLFPFSGEEQPFVQHRVFATSLCFACAFGVWSFFGELARAHDGTETNKPGAVAALKDMRAHAEKAGRSRVTLGLVHVATLHDASLVEALVFDTGVRVGTPSFKPKRRKGAPLVVYPLATDAWSWNAEVRGKDVLTPEAWVRRISDEADYVLVLAGGRYQDRRKGRWPPWIEASEQLRESPLFRPLGSPFKVPLDGAVQLLVRKDFRRD